MSNFTIREDGTFGNTNGCGYGCCTHCKYSKDTSQWVNCSEKCWDLRSGLVGKSCVDCDNKPPYIKK